MYITHLLYSPSFVWIALKLREELAIQDFERKYVVTMATHYPRITKMCLAHLHLNIIIYPKFRLNCFKIEGGVNDTSYWKKIYCYHGNASVPYYNIIFSVYLTYIWLCVPNLIIIARIMRKLFHSKGFGKIMVTMATQNPRITKNVSCTPIL